MTDRNDYPRDFFVCSQGRVLRGPAGREQGAAQRDVRGEDHRQKGAEGQRGLFGQRNQSLAKVMLFFRHVFLGCFFFFGKSVLKYLCAASSFTF